MASVALGLALSSPVALAGHRHGKPNTFEGSCQFAGTVLFDPPATTSPQEGSQSARARGTCSGTFTDGDGRAHELDDARVRYRSNAEGTLACGFTGESPGGTVRGKGHLRFEHGAIHFRFSETRALVALLRYEGKESGGANGEAGASSDESLPDIVQQCEGEGLRKVRVEGSFETDPRMSG